MCAPPCLPLPHQRLATAPNAALPAMGLAFAMNSVAVCAYFMRRRGIFDRISCASPCFAPGLHHVRTTLPVSREPLHESPRRVHLRTRAVCGVANARNSCGYCCALRLAAHPDPQRTLSAQFVQRIPRAYPSSASSYIFNSINPAPGSPWAPRQPAGGAARGAATSPAPWARRGCSPARQQSAARPQTPSR